MLSKLLHCCLLLIFSGSLLADEQLVLQLKWEHQFQFAGYYAAKWQGYYKDAGLDVEIRSAVKADKILINPNDELKKGKAQFAVGALDILTGKDKGAEPVILASIFQHSPTAVFSLAQTDISSLAKLSKLRIATTGADFTQTEIKALFRSQGFDLAKINFVNQPVTIDTLINDQADAIVTYEISAKFAAQEQGITLNQLNPTELGLAFYGDSLYTSLEYARKHPDIVKKFTAASIKGWRYALEHKQEIAQRIAEQFPRYLVTYNNLYQYNLFFAQHIDPLLQYPQKPLGDVNKERWFNMNERVRALGLVHSHLNDSHFNLPEKAKEPQSFFTSRAFYLLSILVICSAVIFFLWHRQHKILTILALLAAIAAFEIQLEAIFIDEEKRAERENTAQIINAISAKLQGEVQNNLSMLTGFAAYISATPNLSEHDFNRYAEVLFRKDPLLISFSAAKDLVIKYVFPLAGNEKAIGLSYRNTPDQLPMVEEVIKSGQVQMGGPINLVQGGTAFIGRAPIFLPEGKLWGIISAPLNAQLLFKFSEIEQASEHFNIAIRSYDAQGKAGAVFFGDAAVFDSPDKLLSRIYIGGHSWHIAATAKPDNNGLAPNIYLLRGYFIISAVIFSLFIWFRFEQISRQKELQLKRLEDKRLLESVGRVAKIGGWKIDDNLNFIKWSQQSSLALAEAEDFSPATLADLRSYFSEEDYLLWQAKVKQALKTAKAFNIELQVRPKNAQPLWLRIMSDGQRVLNSSCIAGTIQDVTDKILSAQLIEYQASFDSLTDLPNRRSYQERLELAIKNARRSSNRLAVLFIDLDRFKPINDNYGHQAGDQVLVEAAARLKAQLRDSDTVARLSGDEFALIVNNMTHYQDALSIAEKISQAMQQPYQLSSTSAHLSVSIGIALYPDDADSAVLLLKKADQAMYEVKASGRNGCQFYTHEMQLKSEYRHQLRNKLITALQKRELQPYFQPIIDLKSNKISKCETLARWQQENGDFIPPIEFISLAEESGLINQIDLFMLEESSQQLIAMNSATELSINVSPRLFHTKDNALQNWLTAIEKISQSVNITVEITERLLTDDSEKALAILKKFKSIGIKIAIDDFGSGYSSLNYLVKFPVDLIKIDRSFIKNIGIDPSSETLIETILAMAKRLNIEVVAEGIETQAQLTYLQQHNCAYGQGYFLGKPMSRADFHALLKTH